MRRNPKNPPTPGPGRPKGSKNRITIARMEQEYRRVAFSNILAAFDGVHGNKRKFTLRELKAMPEDMQRCISSVKVRTENLTAGDGKQDTTVEIKLWDKMAALEQWAKHFGWAKDRIVVEGDSIATILQQRHAKYRKDEPSE